MFYNMKSMKIASPGNLHFLKGNYQLRNVFRPDVYREPCSNADTLRLVEHLVGCQGLLQKVGVL